MSAKFAEWCRKIQSIAQSGLAYSKDPFDIERFQQLRTLVGEMLSSGGEHADAAAVQSILDAEQGYRLTHLTAVVSHLRCAPSATGRIRPSLAYLRTSTICTPTGTPAGYCCASRIQAAFELRFPWS